MENIQKKEKHNQVCVWPGTTVQDNQIEDFENYFKDAGFRVQYLESVNTMPDRDETGSFVPETGGRTDVIFALHDEDITKFAIPRLQMGIRWIEDVLDNEIDGQSIYESRITGYRTW